MLFLFISPCPIYKNVLGIHSDCRSCGIFGPARFQAFYPDADLVCKLPSTPFTNDNVSGKNRAGRTKKIEKIYWRYRSSTWTMSYALVCVGNWERFKRWVLCKFTQAAVWGCCFNFQFKLICCQNFAEPFFMFILNFSEPSQWKYKQGMCTHTEVYEDTFSMCSQLLDRIHTSVGVVLCFVVLTARSITKVSAQPGMSLQVNSTSKCNYPFDEGWGFSTTGWWINLASFSL